MPVLTVEPSGEPARDALRSTVLPRGAVQSKPARALNRSCPAGDGRGREATAPERPECFDPSFCPMSRVTSGGVADRRGSARLEGDLKLVKWMLAIVIAATVIPLLKNLLG